MAHFHIDPGTPSLALPASRKGQFSFTVTNNLGRAVRIQASVLPDGGAKPEWLSIDGEAERDLSQTETQTFIVKVQVPPDVPPGEQRFRLLVASVAHPDDEYDTSPPVAFKISEATRPPFPWWIVIVAAAVLVIVGGGLGLYFALQGPGLGAKCDLTKPNCRSGYTCSKQGSQAVCLGNVGAACKAGTDCATGPCGAGGKCEQQPPGANCGSDTDCPADQTCTDVRPGVKACLLKPGQPCTQSALCSMWCIQTKHVCAPENGACTAVTDCASGADVCAGGICKVAQGKPCSGGADCVTNFCQGGTCQPCPPGVLCIQLPHLRPDYGRLLVRVAPLEMRRLTPAPVTPGQ